MKSTESDVCYFEVDAVFNREPVELLEERYNGSFCEPLCTILHAKYARISEQFFSLFVA